jgi:hypothetical protein
MRPILSITRQLDSPGIVKRLQREQQEMTAGSLAFFEIDFDEDIEEAAIAYLRSCARNRRRFVEFDLFLCPGNAHVHKVLETAVELDLFSKIYMKGTKHPEYQQPSLNALLGRTTTVTLPNVRNLAKLQFSFLTFHRQDALALRSCLEGSNSPLTELLLSNIQFLEGALVELSHGLRTNSSLQCLAMIGCALTDAEMGGILMDSLVAHPSLKCLRLFGNQCRAVSAQNLVRWLSRATCRLDNVGLPNQFLRNIIPRGGGGGGGGAFSEGEGDCRMRIEDFLQGWKRCCRNKSLKRLVLSGNKLDDDDMGQLALLLRRLPCLEELDLDANQISNQGLQCFAQHDTPSRLRILRLAQNNQLTKEASPTLVKILQVHPELHTVVISGVSWKSTPEKKELQHLLDVNRAGRVLLSRPIPLSVWPLVFARLSRPRNPYGGYVNQRLSDNAKNGIYYLLRHGPILFERSMTSSDDVSSDSCTAEKQLQSVSRKRKRE